MKRCLLLFAALALALVGVACGQKAGNAELVGLGGLRRSLVRARVRGSASLQSRRVVHGFQRRARRQTARRQRRELRRDFAVERRRYIDCSRRTRGASRFVENSVLRSTLAEAARLTPGQSQRPNLWRAVRLGTQSAALRHHRLRCRRRIPGASSGIPSTKGKFRSGMSFPASTWPRRFSATISPIRISSTT